MISGKYLPVIALVISVVSLSSCISMEPVILHGDISGSVIDAETSDPIQAATVELIQSNNSTDTTSTGTDGIYLLKNINPGDYEIHASKFAYGASSKDVKVSQAETSDIDFMLSGVPVLGKSTTYLDFGLDQTSISFIISNIGKKRLVYSIVPSQDWITVNPFSGEITDETDTILVTINRANLADSLIYKQKIEITSTGGPAPVQDTVGVYINGVMDIRDKRYYKIVKIGTQTWMAENLDVGVKIAIESGGVNNGILEKFCYHDDAINCAIYGGLYDWPEAMDYNPSDSGITGVTRGICPENYHMPTEKEWQTLLDWLGGNQIAGGKLKETGTVHWKLPNAGATNETGFTALPGGFCEGTGAAGIPVLWSYDINSTGTFWTATVPSGYSQSFGSNLELKYSSSFAEIRYYSDRYLSFSVRCIKNP